MNSRPDVIGRWYHTIVHGAIVSFVAMNLAGSPLARAAEAKDARAQYYERLARLPPRDVSSLVELGDWCKSAGLEDESHECYRRAIAIDSDCASARTALGYLRYGTGWTLPGEKRAPRRKGTPTTPAPVSGSAGTPSTTKTPSGPGPAAPEPAEMPVEASPEAKDSAQDTSPSPEEAAPGVSKVERVEEAAAKSVEAEIERKKAWAKAAGEKIAVTFSTWQDGDFLVHTTLASSSRELKALQGNLRASKKILVGLLSLTSSTRIWPWKLQIFLVKSQTEFERVAELIDGIKSATSPEGGYFQGDHLVVLKPESEMVPRTVGETSTLRMDDSDRPVGRWLREGIAEWVYAQSPQGSAKRHYATTMAYAGEVIRSDASGVRIFDLVEASDWKTQEIRRNRALSLSLVDFLFKSRRRGLHDFVLALKSSSAPASPKADEDPKVAQVRAIAFQEEAMKDAFKASLDVLDEKWKLYVLGVADGLKAMETETKDAAKTAKKKGR